MPVQLSKSGVFFDAAKSGLTFDQIKPSDLSFLSGWFNDCDGCLLDSEYLAMGDLGSKIDEALKAAGHASGLNNPNFVSDYAGWHADKIIAHIADEKAVVLNQDSIKLAHKTSVIETLRRDVQTFEGMDAVLTLIKAGAGGRAAVVTSSENARVQPGLEKNGIFHHFIADGITHIYSGPDVKARLLEEDKTSKFELKPEPDIYLHAAKEMGLDIKDTGTFEDSFSGAKSAVAAGVGYIIGFVGGSHIPHNGKAEHAQKLLDIGVHRVIRDVREMPAALVDIHRDRQAALKLTPAQQRLAL